MRDIFALTDTEVTLGETTIAVSAIEFDNDEVELRRSDWNEDVISSVNKLFFEENLGENRTQPLVISAPDRKFKFRVTHPTVRRRVDEDGPTVVFRFPVHDLSPTLTYIGDEADE